MWWEIVDNDDLHNPNFRPQWILVRIRRADTAFAAEFSVSRIMLHLASDKVFYVCCVGDLFRPLREVPDDAKRTILDLIKGEEDFDSLFST